MFTDAELEQLAELLDKNVDLTLAEIKEHFRTQCSLVAIHNTLAKLGFVFKKNSEGKRTRSQGHRLPA